LRFGTRRVPAGAPTPPAGVRRDGCVPYGCRQPVPDVAAVTVVATVTRTKRRPASRSRRGRPAGRRRARGGGFKGILGRQAHDVWGLVLVLVGLLAGLGVYADMAGPVGRGIRDGTGDVFG